MQKENFISELSINQKIFKIIDLNKISQETELAISKLPITLRILLENSLRNAQNDQEFSEIINKFTIWLKNAQTNDEIMYFPARILMQDFTGVPAVVDLAAMRHALKEIGGNPEKINPTSPVDLVIDHSVQVDKYASDSAVQENTDLEIKRNYERYEFLKWGQKSFDNFRVVPPGTGICHQVNLEYLASVVTTKNINGEDFLIPDTLVGTDSHTTMINGVSVLGWGVGGIEAEAAMLGNAISMIIPEVVGFKLTGKASEGISATDIVLTITEKLREVGVVGKFVEFYGSALDSLSLADRATIANMSPEFGSTCGFFPVDQETLNYLELTNRSQEQINIVKTYCQNNQLYRNDTEDKKYSLDLELDLSTVKACLAGPKRPQDKAFLEDVPKSYLDANQVDLKQEFSVENQDYKLQNGDIVIAAITSCTNTSNPASMLAAGLVARNALKYGLKAKPYVKTSLAPGSQVAEEYFNESGLQDDLDQLGFNIVGFGCTSCIGNSGPLNQEIDQAIRENDINVAAVLSGNRNFEGRVHPLTKANYLASPALVVAYAILGNIAKDITKTPLGQDQNGKDIFLKDIWPSTDEVNQIVTNSVTQEMFKKRYAQVFDGEKGWQDIPVSPTKTYEWNDNSTYIQNPPFFSSEDNLADIENAKILALFGDSITTDHISPAGVIAGNSPAASYLAENGVAPGDFNSYGSRRGNHQVMMRGTFANIRIKNEMMAGQEGGYTLYDGKDTSIYDAAMKHQQNDTKLVVIAGKEYGTGSSRDWAAKGTFLLGIKAVIAESFERIHRSNLVGMGVLPLIFKEGDNRKSLELTGNELISLTDLHDISPLGDVICNITYPDGRKIEIPLTVKINTEYELENLKAGGVLQSVVKNSA